MSIGQITVVGFIVGLLFVLIRDISISLSPNIIKATVFTIRRYFYFGIYGSVLSNILFFIWKI
jgi:hypothetical protein